MRKMLSVILSLLLISSLAVSASAAEGFIYCEAQDLITEQLNVSLAEQYIDHLLAEPIPEPERPTPIVHRMVRDVRFFLNTLDYAVNCTGIGVQCTAFHTVDCICADNIWRQFKVNLRQLCRFGYDQQ